MPKIDATRLLATLDRRIKPLKEAEQQCGHLPHPPHPDFYTPMDAGALWALEALRKWVKREVKSG